MTIFIRNSDSSIRNASRFIRHSQFGIRTLDRLVPILKQLHDDLDAVIRNSDFSIRTFPCLVALNHTRAEEEKRGRIRWLRPEYQARGQKSEVRGQQQEIEPVATASKPSAKNQESGTATPWPKALPEQIAAVRSALTALSGPADATAIAKLFKGARKDRIEAILESLQALGHVHKVEEGRYSA